MKNISRTINVLMNLTIDLDTLIKRGILSTPVFKNIETHVLASENVNASMAKRIVFSDNLPEDIANEIANNKERNRLIVRHYLENQDKYQQTIVFALNIRHAIELNAIFEKYNIRSNYIVSNVVDMITGISRSKEQNEENIEAYKKKELQVLINVNILTEGTDLPQTKTVFLTRPTVSKVLMTQMVGRALRGVKAGGTKDAYIVSFIDDWEDKIAFEAPETILLEGTIPADKEYEHRKQTVRFIAISLIEEFARISDDTVDMRRLENLPFSDRVPVGMYMVTYQEDDPENESSVDRNYSVLVYNNSKKAYASFVSDLGKILKEYGVEGEQQIGDDIIDNMIDECRKRYFDTVVLPPCKDTDIEAFLKYYAYCRMEPTLRPMEEIDRAKVNLSYIAQDLLDRRLDDYEKKEELDKLWNDESTLLKLYYTEFEYFKRQLDKEINKIVYETVSGSSPKIKYEQRELEEMTVHQIRERDPKYARKIINAVYDDAFENGVYKCKKCGMTSKNRIDFQIDHIYPMSEGGKTVFGNLQLLCRKCNKIKNNKIETQHFVSSKVSDDVKPSVRRTGDKLTVRLGDEVKNFSITKERKERGYMTFQIGGKRFKYNTKKKRLE